MVTIVESYREARTKKQTKTDCTEAYRIFIQPLCKDEGASGAPSSGKTGG